LGGVTVTNAEATADEEETTNARMTKNDDAVVAFILLLFS
jgi:hypothetical protein